MKSRNPDTLFVQALQAGQNRNYEKAISILIYILSNYDYHPKILLYLGRSYHATGNYNKAVSVYDFYLKMNPGSSAGNFFIGRTYLTLGIFKKSILHFKAALKDKNSPYYFLSLSLIALSFLKAKRPDIAIPYLEEALKIDPKNEKIFNLYLNALLVKAIKLFQNNLFHDSAKIFDFLLKNKKDSILPHLYLARIFRLSGNNKSALYHYDIASKMSPDDKILKLQKAVTLLKIGNTEEAHKEIKYFSKLINKIDISTNDPGYLLKYITMTHFHKNEYRKAIYYAKEILKENYDDIEMHAIIAESYQRLGDLEKAKNHYTRCIERDANRLEIYYGISYVLWEKGEYKELLNKVNRIKKINQNDKVADYFYALCLSKTGKTPKEILPLLQEQIRKNGPDILLMNALGEAYLKYDMPELSENWFLRIIKLSDNNKTALENLIEVYHKLDKLKKEKEFYRRYLKIFPADIPLRKKYIKLLIDKTMFKPAIKELLILLPLSKRKASIKKTLAHCYMKACLYEEATIILRELLQDNPDSIEYLQALILCLDNTFKREFAIKLLEKAVKYFKNEFSILLMLGILYSKQGLYQKAIKIFRDIIANNPKSWRAYKNLGLVYKKMNNTEYAKIFLKRAEEYREKN